MLKDNDVNTTIPTAPAHRRPRTPRTHAPLRVPPRTPVQSRDDAPDTSDIATRPGCVGVPDVEAFADDRSTPEVGGTGLNLPATRQGRWTPTRWRTRSTAPTGAGTNKFSRNTLHHARRAGELLLQVKASVGHGRFQSWLQSHCRFSYKTGVKYMRLADRCDRVVDQAGRNLERIPDLTLREELALIADPKPRPPASTSAVLGPAVAPEADGPEPGASPCRPRTAPEPTAPVPAPPHPGRASSGRPPRPRNRPPGRRRTGRGRRRGGCDPRGPVCPRARPEPGAPAPRDGFPWPGLAAGQAAEALDHSRDAMQSALRALRDGFRPAQFGPWDRTRAWGSSAEYRATLARLPEAGSPPEPTDCDRCGGAGNIGRQPCGACQRTGAVFAD